MSRVFRTRTSPALRFQRVVLPLVLSAVCGAAGMLLADPRFTLLAGLATLWALRNWPLGRSDVAQLTLSEDGIAIDGLGRIRWDGVAATAWASARGAGPGGLARRGKVLIVAVNRSWDRALQPDERKDLPRALQVRRWRIRADGLLMVPLWGLEDTAEAVIEAVGAFLGKPVPPVAPAEGRA
jgi:hypothetical protein